MQTLHNSDIVKGSVLMLFVGTTPEPIAFATSHSLSLTVNTTEVSTKDHGAYPAVLANSITWQCSTENLYSDAAVANLMSIAKAKQPVTIKFAKAGNWSDNGIVENEHANWTPDATNTIAEGKAIITSLNINAPAGDNATLTAEFTGVGELVESE